MGEGAVVSVYFWEENGRDMGIWALGWKVRIAPIDRRHLAVRRTFAAADYPLPLGAALCARCGSQAQEEEQEFNTNACE